MWRRVELVWTDVSEERIASIFRVEKSEVCSHLLTLVPRLRIFLPRRWRRYGPPTRRFTQDLGGATSQKTAFFIVTAVKTSNLHSHGCETVESSGNTHFVCFRTRCWRKCLNLRERKFLFFTRYHKFGQIDWDEMCGEGDRWEFYTTH
jgi:hypothetical protein